MAKLKSAYFCQNCGHEAPKWLGKCPSCNEWNTFVEELIEKTLPGNIVAFSKSGKTSKPTAILEIKGVEQERHFLADKEINRVLGGGLVLGSLVLFGGEPGIGKSTLMLQLAISDNNLQVLYVSGEESEQQIKMRAERIGVQNPKCFILSETNIQNIFKQAEEIQPQLLVIDSIQTLYSSDIESSPGSISQVRECTAQLLRYAKTTNIPVFLIGHITKEGSLAGPKVLEHMVDTVLQFEGDRNHVYRLLRSVKNRFGSTNELGIYEMVGSGLRQVENPSEILITNADSSLSGISIGATMEGMRPMLIEVQALVSTAAYGTPQRSSTGFDSKRLNMLLAVMEKRCGFKLGAKDVFLNIAGGIKVDDPALDLAVVASVLSSNADIAINKSICLSAEVGLSGEVRPVNRIDQRIYEAEKLGFEKIIISKYNKGINQKDFKIELVQCGKLDEVVRALFA
ncbi:DNA repair protein RadA [Crocinitomicaceae bacterium CZZ-1]|uniref:DNA repair protein RadA n=1 Tax=Taishania pollutisoli TaxID=2766479 RepID=A0A8J6P9Y4_9FLAO|nr:DNA repair protein RadA [Taishania pollutisoli]MBC9811383.1 DNA repair protein RadA [Taishania pollutisoli]MBX2947702.1 DNA repair protein RadA [Crocinitomicaceae bacterium]NGF75163.1 DNA repair protein RadA [Fluviicola sp. SGL-29]